MGTNLPIRFTQPPRGHVGVGKLVNWIVYSAPAVTVALIVSFIFGLIGVLCTYDIKAMSQRG